MEFIQHSFRHAATIFGEDGFAHDCDELLGVLSAVTDERIIGRHKSYPVPPASISRAINDVLREDLTARGWAAESPIFQDTHYSGEKWRLDFAKNEISVEVAFNHGEAIAWNLLKPVLASELNHVQKAVQTQAGVIITCTEALKQEGGFDSAVGTYEKFIDYLKPLGAVLTAPLLLIGLQPFTTFRIRHEKVNGRNRGFVELKTP